MQGKRRPLRHMLLAWSDRNDRVKPHNRRASSLHQQVASKHTVKMGEYVSIFVKIKNVTH
jgi:hypothetical protein